jgi:hypothetical protein
MADLVNRAKVLAIDKIIRTKVEQYMTLINYIIKKLAGAALGLGLAVSAQAQTHYFDADHPGHGVSVTQDNGQGSAFIWYLYDRTGEGTWLISTENCSEYPCEVYLAQGYGAWMGGDFELVEVGSVTISWDLGKLVWDYDLRTWPLAGDCGRMIMIIQNKCVGEFVMEAID